MENRRKVVWALFDDGEQSVLNTLPKDEYKVLSFGIQKKDTVVHLDMTMELNHIIEILNEWDKPDYIVASPPCIVFSKASGIEKGMNAYLMYEDLSTRTKESYEDSMYKFENSPIKGKTKEDFSNMSFDMLKNTIAVIEHFKPKHYYIENPRLSLMWRYIREKMEMNFGFENIAMYGAYNHPVKKPTIFLSDLELDLKTDTKRMKFLKWDKDFTDKTKRSSIPKELLIDIFNQFKKGERNEI